MNIVIIVEIVAGIFVLAGAVVFAVRDTRQRRSASREQEPGPEDVPEVRKDVPEVQASDPEVQASDPEVQASDSKDDAEQHLSEVASRRE